jgi:TRAP-type mannitol/chloroaromatic compound transport system permease large subunit
MFEASFLFNLPCLVGATAIDISWLIEKVSLATWETIYMVIISTVLAYLMGLPLGVILVITEKGHILENIPLNQILGFIVNVFRSIPFIIFLILVIPLTKLLVGGFIGTVVKQFIAALGLGPTGTMIIILLIVFLLGMLIDWVGILLIVVPIFMPIIADFGMDPLWAVMMIVVMLQSSFLTPPFAYALFYIKGIAPKGITITDIYWGVIPFICLILLALVLCWIFPEIITWLPSVLAQARS